MAIKDLSFDDLQLFTRILALGTLSAAARERDVPVSAVSRSLQRMESACSARLLRRSTHGLTLTAEGERFLDTCRSVDANLHQLEAAFARNNAAPAGCVRVSVSTVVAQYALVPALPALRASYPQLQIDLLIDDRLIDMVRDGVDIAIRTGDAAPGTLVRRPLAHLRTGLYASQAYLQTHGLPRSVDALAQHQLLANCAHPVLNTWQFVQGRSMQASAALRADNTAILVALTLQGLGIAQLPTFVGEPLVRRKQLRRLLARQFEPASIRLSALVAADRNRLPKIRACLEHFSAWFAAQNEGSNA